MKKIITAILLIVCISTMLVACDPGTNPTYTSTSNSQKIQKPADHDDNGPPTEYELTNPNIKG